MLGSSSGEKDFLLLFLFLVWFLWRVSCPEYADSRPGVRAFHPCYACCYLSLSLSLSLVPVLVLYYSRPRSRPVLSYPILSSCSAVRDRPARHRDALLWVNGQWSEEQRCDPRSVPPYLVSRHSSEENPLFVVNWCSRASSPIPGPRLACGVPFRGSPIERRCFASAVTTTTVVFHRRRRLLEKKPFLPRNHQQKNKKIESLLCLAMLAAVHVCLSRS